MPSITCRQHIADLETRLSNEREARSADEGHFRATIAGFEKALDDERATVAELRAELRRLRGDSAPPTEPPPAAEPTTRPERSALRVACVCEPDPPDDARKP